MERPRVAVIGAGIIGVSTALRMQQAMPEAEVTIYTDQTSPDTTSDVAAGFWGPSFLQNTPHQLAVQWAKDTYLYLTQLAKRDSPSAHDHGVWLSPGYELYGVDNPPVKYWSHIPIGFRVASQGELAMFPSRVKSGFYFISAVVEGSKFIPYLTGLFQSIGGRLVTSFPVESFAQLHRLGYKHICNCSGLGSRQLCGDALVYPLRGQVHRVSAPWMKFWYDSDDGCYCLVNENHVVLGGVAQPHNWSTAVSERDKAAILGGNYAIWPALRKAPVLADLVGLRPARETVRLEREAATADGENFTIYHNYGHGGSGLTLFWGCAGDAVELVMQDLRAADGGTGSEALTAKL